MKNFGVAKLAMAVFIASEAVFFAFLIAAYIYYYAAVQHGPRAANSLDPGRTLIYTICLLASSGTLWISERQLAADRRKACRLWLGATILLGAVFLFGQGMEYADLITRDITPARNLFGATFFTLTGFHGLHVFCGLVALTVLLTLSCMNATEEKVSSGFGAIAMYWHFVDIVWIVIFSLIYLAVWI